MVYISKNGSKSLVMDKASTYAFNQEEKMDDTFAIYLFISSSN
jgi:PHD/YefM family antitoxin component YafN of YafNO toxin-antitoxin module